jgi:hypothetical protein
MYYLLLAAGTEQTGSPAVGVGGMVFICFILYLLLGGGGPKNKGK